MIPRRTLLAAPIAAPLAAPRAARAQATPKLRVSTAAPPSDFLARALEQMKAELAPAGLDLEVYAAGTLFRQGTEVPALQRGTLEMSTMTTFEVAQQLPEFGFFNRGYLFRDQPQLHRVFDGPIGTEYAAIVASRMGIQILATCYLGTRHVGLRKRRDIRTPADLAGTKLRMPAGPEWLLLGRAIGASPTPMGMAEVYLALKTGTIDAQENPLSIVQAAKLYEVMEQVALTAHLVQPVFINIALPAWQKLTPAQQDALRTAARTAAAANDAARLEDERQIVASLTARGLAVDTPDLAAFRAQADTVYAASDMARAWNADWMKRVLAA
jgi:TRAP-type transport system periplasmic protein